MCIARDQMVEQIILLLNVIFQSNGQSEKIKTNKRIKTRQNNMRINSGAVTPQIQNNYIDRHQNSQNINLYYDYTNIYTYFKSIQCSTSY
jgi:hypothetical protein